MGETREINEKTLKIILIDQVETLAQGQNILAEHHIKLSKQCLTMANLFRGIINLMRELPLEDCYKLADQVLTMMPRDQGEGR